MPAGLWKAYFLPMFRGEITPSMPKEPPNVHIRDRKEVPYTPEEMRIRNAKYKVKKATWDKTMKVVIVCVFVCGMLWWCEKPTHTIEYHLNNTLFTQYINM